MSESSKVKGKVDDIDKLVSSRLKKRRMMLGLSQHNLSAAVDVSIQQIQKYEAATNRISSGKLFAFAKLLKVPVNYFYKQDEEREINSLSDNDTAPYQDTDSEKMNIIKKILLLDDPSTLGTIKKIVELEQ